MMLLISWLELLFGISGKALKWLRSCVSGRTQSVVINRCSSQPTPLSTGIPQGSVAGPGTFSGYIQPIGQPAREHDVHLSLHRRHITGT